MNDLAVRTSVSDFKANHNHELTDHLPSPNEDTDIIFDLKEEDDYEVEQTGNFQELFPLSERPWSDSPPADGLDSACPPHAYAVLPRKGLMAEAECIVDVAEAVTEVREAEEKLARSRAKESILRSRLYKIQAAMATRLVQLSLTQAGKARADRTRRALSILQLPV